MPGMVKSSSSCREIHQKWSTMTFGLWNRVGEIKSDLNERMSWPETPEAVRIVLQDMVEKLHELEIGTLESSLNADGQILAILAPLQGMV